MLTVNLIALQEEDQRKERRRLKMIEYARRYREANPVKHRAAVDRWRRDNKDRCLANAKRWASENKERVKETRRAREMRRYGISSAEYDRMYSAQGGVCAICLESPRGKGRWGIYLHVDHSHTTGKVRGLLCGNCNSALGFMKESVESLERMGHYIKERG